MGKISVGEIIALSDGREYLIPYDVQVERVRYLYLVSTDEPRAIRFAKQSGDGLELIFDKEERKRVAAALSEAIGRDLPLKRGIENE